RSAPHAAWKALVAEQRETVEREPDWLLHHDYLGDVLEGCWLHEIAADARGRGLEYLGDADFGSMLPIGLDPETRATLGGAGGDPVAFQQYLDFLTFRSFRRTLLVRGGAEVDRGLSRDQVRPLYVTTAARDEGDKFRMPAGGEIVIGRARTREA